MPLIVDLPMPVNEELSQDSQREGVSETDHVALLVCLASAFNQEEPHTPFQKAVRVFLSHHALDAAQVFSVFEELVRACLESHEEGKLEASLGKGKTEATIEHALLRHWRNARVHQLVDARYDSLVSETPSSASIAQVPERILSEEASRKEEDDPGDRVRALLAQWQREDNSPLRPSVPTRQGETPTQALFRKWAEEDANMTEEEKEAEDALWEDIEKGIDQNRLTLGLRHSIS